MTINRTGDFSERPEPSMTDFINDQHQLSYQIEDLVKAFYQKYERFMTGPEPIEFTVNNLGVRVEVKIG